MCGFLVLAPGQVSVNDQISRRWTDIIRTASERAKRLKGNQVKYIYYGIMSVYLVWGLVILTLFDPLDLAKFGAVIGTIALGSTSLLAVYANRTLLPKEARPSWFLQLGVVCCGILLLESERRGLFDVSRVISELTLLTPFTTLTSFLPRTARATASADPSSAEKKPASDCNFASAALAQRVRGCAPWPVPTPRSTAGAARAL